MRTSIDRLLPALLAAAIVSGALLLPPRNFGDGAEYLLMAESLARHGTPDLRSGDLESLREIATRHGFTLPSTVTLAYSEGRDGRSYCYHFWAYSALLLPAKLGLRALGLDEFRAAPLTNALLLAAAVLVAGGAAGLGAELAALLALSPALWFVIWPHTEVFSAALVALALLAQARGRAALGVLLAGLGSLQNPPIVVLAAFLALRAAASGPRDPRRLAGLGLALAPAALPFAFYLAVFGAPSLLVIRGEASTANLSSAKALELFVDLDIGLLPYLPVTLALALWQAGRDAFRERRIGLPVQLLAVAVLMAYVSTSTRNWNAGTSGPARYAVWIFPLIAALAAGLGSVLPPPRILLLAAVAAQGVLVAARGGMEPRSDWHEHSAVARFVLDRWPWAYNPSVEVFVERTQGWSGPLSGPVIHRDAQGRCRKAYAKGAHGPALLAACGALPVGSEGFFADPAWQRSWRYLDW
jgi:hypothetical protein